MRVLYVEDNPANVFLVKRVAKMGNHEIINYVDGNEALAQYKVIDPDLVLMDIQISGELTGLDVVRRLRADGVVTPIIAVTAYAMVGDRERCIDAGCTDYLAKPLPIPQLVQIFEHYSKSRFSTSELERLGTTKQELGTSKKVETLLEPPTKIIDAPLETPSKSVDMLHETPTKGVEVPKETPKSDVPTVSEANLSPLVSTEIKPVETAPPTPIVISTTEGVPANAPTPDSVTLEIKKDS